jgi:hypothetical protein
MRLNMNIKTLTSALILTANAAVLLACADGRYQPSVLDYNYGKSVNSVKYAQIADKEAAAHPPVNSPRKMDGYAGVNVMGTYRDGFAVLTQQPPSVNINIGGASSEGQ